MGDRLFRKGLVVGIILLFIGAGFASSAQLKNDKTLKNYQLPLASGKTIYVDDDNTEGPWDGTMEHPYQHIQEGVDNAIDGDTVYVSNGIYNETPRIRKSVNLKGENKYSTIIRGNGGSGDTVGFFTDDITISGFTIENSGDWANDAGIGIQSAWGTHSWYNIISGNIIAKNKHYGIDLYESSYNKIINNIIMDNSDNGINFVSYCNNNVIYGNTIVNDTIRFGGAPSYNQISDNYIRNGGIRFDFASGNTIEYNTIEQSAGITLCKTSGNTICYNTLISSDGIFIDRSPQSIVINNELVQSNGIIISGENLNYWNTHGIENNKINGKPIYYYKNEDNLIVPSNAGQVILANCKNLKLKNLDISDVRDGITIAFSSYNTISSSIIKNCYSDGIILYDSSNNEIFNNMISNNIKNGIKISAVDNYIHNNIIRENGEKGICIYGNQNLIKYNSILKNKIGIFLDRTNKNMIMCNNFINNKQINAYFIADTLEQKNNTWDSNYWNWPFKFFPKIILGSIKSKYYWEDPFTFEKIYFYLPCICLDHNPAKLPYFITNYIVKGKAYHEEK